MFKKIFSAFGKRAEVATQKNITDKWFPSLYSMGIRRLGQNPEHTYTVFYIHSIKQRNNPLLTSVIYLKDHIQANKG